VHIADWRTRDVWAISFSAFFADLGYQAILAIFPLYLVLHLGAPIWLFGLSQALAYGPGALFGYLGGILGDRYGRWGMSILGNSFIPLMALVGLTTVPAAAVGLLTVGWWARNFRSPPRRALLVEAVAPDYRGEAFGLLHALDVGGGLLAAAYAFLLLLAGIGYTPILLLTIIPLATSTVVLLLVRVGRSRPTRASDARTPPDLDPARPGNAVGERWVFWGVMSATVLYGFASFSIGFPVLTTAQGIRSAVLGILVFVVALGVSSAIGLIVGRIRHHRVLALALVGYLVAAAGSLLFAFAAGFGEPLSVYLGAAAVLGAALGAVETFEPTLIAAVSPPSRTSQSLGSLTAFRSIGLFASNLILGLLFLANRWLPYIYAGLAALAATMMLVVVARRVGSLGDV
jgi:MFS family permease